MASKINKQKIIAAAQKYLQKGQYDRAIREYTKIVEDDPRDVRIWLKIGDLCARKGDKQEAVETYLRVAEFYSEQGFYPKAVAVYKQIHVIDATRVEVNQRLAELYKQLGLLKEAMQQYELVSNYYAQRGSQKEAVAALKEIVGLAPENVAYRIRLAELYSKEQMRPDAIREFALAADFLRANNRIDDFVKVAERLVYHDPDNIQVTKELAALYLRRRDPRRALQKLQVAFKADPRDEDTLESLAQAFRDLGQTPKTISVLKELARIRGDVGAEEKRLEAYRLIHELAPEDTEARRVLGIHDGPDGSGGPIEPVASDTFTKAVPHRTGTQSIPRHTGGSYRELQASQPSQSAERGIGDSGSRGVDSRPVIHQPVADVAQDVTLDEDVARIINETDVYIKYGLHDRAVDHLRQVFGRDPNNVSVRLKLKDLYVTMGRPSEAAIELTSITRFLLGQDPEAAKTYLDEAFRLDPENHQARELLAEFGQLSDIQSAHAYDDGVEIDDVAEQVSIEVEAEEDAFEEIMPIDLDNEDIVEEIPIEASDLIEIDNLEDIEDPVPLEPEIRATPPDLTGFDEDILTNVDYRSDQGSSSIELSGETTDTLGGGTPSAEVIALPAISQLSVGQRRVQQEEETVDLADDLEEADFFLQQGLFDEAENILSDLVQRLPGNELIAEKIAEIAELRRSSITPGAASLHGFESEIPTSSVQDEEDYSAPQTADATHTEAFAPSGPEPKAVRTDVQAQVADDDSDTHYDLGIAYREMGLIDDAISEFRTAMRASDKRVLCHTMIGLCQIEKSMIGEAINEFKTGLYVEGISERESTALYFELGQAYEQLDDGPEALFYYEKVNRRDPEFRDVADRIKHIRASVGDTPTDRSGTDRGGDSNGVGQRREPPANGV